MFEAVVVYRSTLEPMHTLMRGSLEQCKQRLVEEIQTNRWEFDDLSIINLESGRHISYSLEW